MAGNDGRPSNGAPAGPRRKRRAVPIGDLITDNLAPALKKRGFATADLVMHWANIVGPAYGQTTMPEQLAWPRRPRGLISANDLPEPATLTVRCTGAMAVRLAHDAPLLIERINTYFGFRAVGRVKVLQAPMRVQRKKTSPPPKPVDPAEMERLRALCAGIDDENLRRQLLRLGANVGRARRDGRQT